MFEHLVALPDDPILGLASRFRADPNPRKVDLTVGVYKDENGHVPILRAVREGERRYVEAQTTKSYIGIAGNSDFLQEMERLVFGADILRSQGGRIRSVQTPGGCAALYGAAMLLRQASATRRIWVSDPTWSNHVPLFKAVGIEVLTYPYYHHARHTIMIDEMLAALEKAQPGDVLLLHGCCHNPTGADLSLDQWSAVLDLVERRGMTPLVDLAYQGFGRGLNEDVAALRHLISRLPEAFITTSCSKNFGLYRDRVGCLSVLATTEKQAVAAQSHILKIARCSYSMPPAHGAGIVQMVLSSPNLKAEWMAELEAMRTRILAMRRNLARAISGRGGQVVYYLKTENGMFSMLPLTPDQAERLRKEYGIYIVDSGRINLCGLTDANIDYVADALSSVWSAAV